ncbi:MAG: hypothetical protein K9M54_12820 [Kiritimatiellales bacterium]|nr:hypothetical protein [Kiritimatiellales bacterium]
MIRNSFHRFAMAASAGLLAGCTTLPLQTWMDPQFKDRAIGKTAVLALADNIALCGQYENLFVKSLTEHGITAVSLRATMKITDQLTKEQLAAELQAKGYNSIIVTKVLSKTSHDRGQGASGVSVSADGDYWTYYSYSSTPAQTTYPVSITESDLEAILFDVKSGKIAWSGRMSVCDSQSNLSNMEIVIRSVVKDLEKKNLL